MSSAPLVLAHELVGKRPRNLLKFAELSELLLAEAEKMGGLYGQEASRAGMPLAEAVEAFLYYRSPVLEAIAAHLRRRAADISDVTAAHREATAAIDQVLVALVSSYRSA